MSSLRHLLFCTLVVSSALALAGLSPGRIRVSSDHAGIIRSEAFSIDFKESTSNGTIAVLVKAHALNSQELHEFQNILVPSLLRNLFFKTTLTVLYEGDQTLVEEATQPLRKNKYIQSVVFVNVTDFFVPTPAEIAMLKGPDIHMHGFGMGYRKMCEFWAVHIFKIKDLHQFRYLWRLDTDSELMSPVTDNLYEVMNTNNAVFGYLLLQDALPEACRGFQKTTENFYAANSQWAPAGTPAQLFLQSFEARRCPHWNTNFQVTDLDFFRSSRAYDEFTKNLVGAVHGFVRYRWGDHLVQTLFLLTQVEPSRTICMQPWVPGYRHQGKRPNCKPELHEPLLMDRSI